MKSKVDAETSYKKGDIILRERPFAFILSNKFQSERCAFCFKEGDLLKCTGCGTCHYCDRLCQKNDWYFHKFECRNFKRIYPKILPDAARLLARIIIKLELGGAREQSFYAPRLFRVFMDLMSHYQEIKADKKRMEHLESLSVVLHEFLGSAMMPNAIELLRIYGKMAVNTFSILDEEMHSIGTGMYLGASVVDHSCSPNAVVLFDGTTLIMRTLIDLPSLDWSKIFISYIDLMRLPSERQKELQGTYYFLCQCRRCKDVDELRMMTSTLCQNQDCRETVPGGAKKPGARCPECREVVTNETWEEILEISEFTNQQLTSMKDVAYLDVCRMCLRKQEGLLDKMHILRGRVLDLAMDSCIKLGNWEGAVEYGKQLIEPFQQYYGTVHPLTGMLFMRMGKIALLLKDRNNARKWLKEAAIILRITHGNEHQLVRKELLDCIRQCSD